MVLVTTRLSLAPSAHQWLPMPDEWWQAREVNLRGPLYCAQAVLPGPLARSCSWIVNFSSGAGFAAIPIVSAYVVGKTTLYRLIENLAVETRGHGAWSSPTILVWRVRRCPRRDCPVANPVSSSSSRTPSQTKAMSPPMCPATLVVYLASGAANALSGRNLDVSDDVPHMVARAAELEEDDLHVLREREWLTTHPQTPPQGVTSGIRKRRRPSLLPRGHIIRLPYAVSHFHS